LRQCRVTAFRGSGPGGQSVNTADSAVRLVHEPSGLVVVARRERSQLLNKRAALARLRIRLVAAAHVPTPRTATRPTRAAQERRLATKRHQASKKHQRSTGLDDD
jgi:protein subunit release factor B